MDLQFGFCRWATNKFSYYELSVNKFVDLYRERRTLVKFKKCYEIIVFAVANIE